VTETNGEQLHSPHVHSVYHVAALLLMNRCTTSQRSCLVTETDGKQLIQFQISIA
jgi:hypothetical protein